MDLKERSKELRGILESLKPEYTKRLQEAIAEEEKATIIMQSKEAQTDRSENAVYQSAKDAVQIAQGHISRYSMKLELLNSYSPEYVPVGTIKINTTVSFEIQDNTGQFDKDYVMLLVPAGLGDASNSLLDSSSALGSALLSRMSGEVVEYQSLTGLHSVKIKEIY